MDATTSLVIVERPAPHSLPNITRPTYLRDTEPTLRRQSTRDLRRDHLASISATGQLSAESTTGGRTRTRHPLLSECTAQLTPRKIAHPTTTSLQQAHSATLAPIRSTTSSRSSYTRQQCDNTLLNYGSMPLLHHPANSQHIQPQDSIPAPVHPSTSSAPLSARVRSDSSSSTLTTSVSYLRSAAEAVIANAHQTHFQQYPPPDNNDSSHPRLTSHWTRAHTHSQHTIGSSDGSSISSSAHSSLSSPLIDIRLDSYNVDPTRGVAAGQQSHGSAQGFNSTTTPPFPELGQQDMALYWRQQEDEPAVHNDGRTLSSSDLDQHHTQRMVHDDIMQLQSRKDLSTLMPPPQSRYSLFPRPEDASTMTMTDNTPGGSWVSDLNSEEKGIAQRQHAFLHRGATPRALRPAETQESEDREVYRVCRGRLEAFFPGRNNHRKCMGTIQSSYLASSRGAYKEGSRPHHTTTLKEHPREQGQSLLQDHDGYILTDGQENNGRRHSAYPMLDVEHAVREKRNRDSQDRIREQELLTIITRLEQQVADLSAANMEVESSLQESDQRCDRLIKEYDAKLLQMREEYDRSVLDTKHRTKRLFDQVMRKQRLDEGKRLATVFKELQSVQSENTELQARIQTMQETILGIEQDSKDDAGALNRFWDRELGPSLRIGVSLHAQDTLTTREKPSLPKRGTDSLWDTVHGQGQRQGQLGVSKATMSCSKIGTIASRVAASIDADADADADADDGRGVGHGLGPHACKTPLGQQCLALLQHIMTALIEPWSSHDHGCRFPDLHCTFAGQGQDLFIDRRQQRKRYSDSSASSGKTIVASHSRQPSHTDCRGGSLLSCATGPRLDPVKYFGELRDEHQREIERIKAQCVSVYRESLEDVRAEMLAKMRSKVRVGYDKR